MDFAKFRGALKHLLIEGKSAVIFCHQAAAWVLDIFSNFYLVKSHKISDRSATTEARKKISADLESVEI
jgi:hypothetical protein